MTSALVLLFSLLPPINYVQANVIALFHYSPKYQQLEAIMLVDAVCFEAHNDDKSLPYHGVIPLSRPPTHLPRRCSIARFMECCVVLPVAAYHLLDFKGFLQGLDGEAYWPPAQLIGHSEGHSLH